MSRDTWQLLPELTTEEYQALKSDIAAQGVLVPIVLDDETGEVIEGYHRLRAWTELRGEGVKVADYPKQVVRFASDDDRVAFVLAANLFRRHLTRSQRAEVVAKLRGDGWSLRRISDALGVGPATIHRDLGTDPDGSLLPERIVGRDGRSQPRTRPRPTIFVQSDRDARRAADALQALGDDAPQKLLSLKAAEERARDARLAQLRSAKVPPKIEGPAYELRLGDLREIWADLPDASVDAIVTDPPYNEAGVPLYRDLAELAARVLKPGRLAAVYCGHVHLDEEMALLEAGGLTYAWHGVNVLPGQHTKVHARMVNGRHRSVLLYSAGRFTPRRWIHDAFWAEGRGGPETRTLHPWQQALEPVRHWLWMTSEPGETVLDPFLGSGTTAIAAVTEGRRFIGGDIDAACVETTRLRLEELAGSEAEHGEKGADDAS